MDHGESREIVKGVSPERVRTSPCSQRQYRESLQLHAVGRVEATRFTVKGVSPERVRTTPLARGPFREEHRSHYVHIQS